MAASSTNLPLRTRLRPLAPVLAVLGLYIVLRPLLGFGHELAVAGLAWLAHAAIATGWWTGLVGACGSIRSTPAPPCALSAAST